MSDPTESKETESCFGRETLSGETVGGEGRPFPGLDGVNGFFASSHGEEVEEDGEVGDCSEGREGEKGDSVGDALEIVEMEREGRIYQRP